MKSGRFNLQVKSYTRTIRNIFNALFLLTLVFMLGSCSGDGASHDDLYEYILSDEEINDLLKEESPTNQALRKLANDIKFGGKRDIERHLRKIAAYKDKNANILFMHFIANQWKSGTQKAEDGDENSLSSSCSVTSSAIYKFVAYRGDEKHLKRLEAFHQSMLEAFPFTEDLQASCVPSVSTSYARKVGVEKSKKYLEDNEGHIINNAMYRSTDKLALSINTEAMVPFILQIYEKDKSKIYDDDEVLAQLSLNPDSDKFALIFEEAATIEYRRGPKDRYLRAKYLIDNLSGAKNDSLDKLVNRYVELAASADGELQLDYLKDLVKVLIKTDYSKKNDRLLYLLQTAHQDIYKDFSNSEIVNIYQFDDFRNFKSLYTSRKSGYDRRRNNLDKKVDLLVFSNILRKQNPSYEKALKDFPLLDNGQIIAGIYGPFWDSQYDSWYIPKGASISNIKKIRTTQIVKVEHTALPEVDLNDEKLLKPLVAAIDFSKICQGEKNRIFHKAGFIQKKSGHFTEVECMSGFASSENALIASCEKGETGMPHLNICYGDSTPPSSVAVKPSISLKKQDKPINHKENKNLQDPTPLTKSKKPQNPQTTPKDKALRLLREGTALAKNGQYNKSVTYFEESIKLDTTNVSAFNNYALVLKKLGRLNESLKIYNVALKLAPEVSVTHKNVALLHEQLAIREYEEYISKAPNAKDAVKVTNQLNRLKAKL